MAVELLLPGRRIPTPEPPSYLALDMAFGVGNPAILGDKSRYNSHGTIVGAVPAAGVHGYCLDFDPTIPSYVEIPAAHTQLNFTSENFSAVIRIFFTAPLTKCRVLDKGIYRTRGWLVEVLNTGIMNFITSQALANQNTACAAGGIVAGQWYTLGFSRHGADAEVYRNGIDFTAAHVAHINPVTAVGDLFTIGIRNNLLADPLDGQIEFLRIFRNIALPASSHLAWHNALV